MAGDTAEGTGVIKCAAPSLFASLDSITVLTCNDLNLRRCDLLVLLHLETRILHDERPHVVAEAVCVEVALSSTNVPSYRIARACGRGCGMAQDGGKWKEREGACVSQPTTRCVMDIP